jgi:thiamine biosynthesis lipoprotein
MWRAALSVAVLGSTALRPARAVAACALFAACRATAPAYELAGHHEFVERHMGCAARIVIVSDDAEAARRAACEAFDVIARCDDELSDYRADNAVAELARRAGSAERVAASDLLLDALDRAEQVTAATDRAFDVTSGPLVSLWRTARRTGELPSNQSIAQARALVDVHAIDRDGASVRLARAGMALDFGGIGKGLAADRALARLRELGFACALVGIEGDLALGTAPPGTLGWFVRATSGASGDGELLALAECGVSTSGDAVQHVVIGGRRYSHIVDPRSGRALEHAVRATVIARDATDADAFATAFSVLGRRRALVIATARDLEARIVERAAGERVTTDTPGYARFIAPGER